MEDGGQPRQWVLKTPAQLIAGLSGTPLIQATQEAEIRRIMVPDPPGQK
jgi:hypothetical protein